MIIVEIIFWLLLGLFYLGVGVRYQEIVIGLCALIIGIDKFVAWIRSR